MIYTPNWFEQTTRDYRKQFEPINNNPPIQGINNMVSPEVTQIKPRWLDRRLAEMIEVWYC